ncbi:hypothetical protein LZ32DRAFT_76738 [Colletotrichum eremochloae]|nr:hypothetical protein LZ32DRAFT_76738 [Colletotrichum eremochloae]
MEHAESQPRPSLPHHAWQLAVSLSALSPRGRPSSCPFSSFSRTSFSLSLSLSLSPLPPGSLGSVHLHHRTGVKRQGTGTTPETASAYAFASAIYLTYHSLHVSLTTPPPPPPPPPPLLCSVSRFSRFLSRPFSHTLLRSVGTQSGSDPQHHH